MTQACNICGGDCGQCGGPCEGNDRIAYPDAPEQLSCGCVMFQDEMQIVLTCTAGHAAALPYANLDALFDRADRDRKKDKGE